MFNSSIGPSIVTFGSSFFDMHTSHSILTIDQPVLSMDWLFIRDQRAVA